MEVRMTESKKNVLVHYGILGMKWGVRRTPEQLGHRPSRTKKVSLEGQPLKYDSPLMREARHTAMMVPVHIAATIIPGFGLVWNAGAVNKLRKEWDTKVYESPQNKISELYKKTEKESSDIFKDVSLANDTGKKGNIKNCFNCVSALEMRQRGYDVKATKRSIGVSSTEYLKYYKGVKIDNSSVARKERQSRKAWVQESYNKLCSDIEKVGPKARGFLAFTYENASSGHTIMWATDSSGSVSFFDPQNGSRNATNTMSLSNQNYEWGRLDNCQVSNNITDLVENRRK